MAWLDQETTIRRGLGLCQGARGRRGTGLHGLESGERSFRGRYRLGGP